ncbi:MAG: hypothetical protein GX927_13945 [Lentisphaerae bacterium]|nr:hypothetical protein [Lentisphaerota bacterium]
MKKGKNLGDLAVQSRASGELFHPGHMLLRFDFLAFLLKFISIRRLMPRADG